MSRLPTPGSDKGTWGNVLNDFLGVAHNADGTIKNNAVTSAMVDGSVEVTANKDTDSTLSANSDLKYPSQKAIKTYVDSVAAPAAAVILAPASSTRNVVQPTGDFKPLVVQGSAGQTANLQEWQDSTGAALATVSSAGSLSITQASASNVAVATKVTGDANNRFQVTEDGTMSWGDGTTAPTSANVTNLKWDSVWGTSFQKDSASAALSLVGSSNGNPTLQMAGSRGTLATPTASQSSDITGKFDAYGYGTTGWKLGGRLFFQTNQAYTDTAAGTLLRVELAPNNSTTRSIVMYANAQGLTIGANSPPTGTVEKLRVTNPTTIDNAANVMFTASATTSKPLVIQGIASQSANLQEWQSSAGTILAGVTSAGTLINRASSSGAGVLGTRISGDANDRLAIANTGALSWGDGTAVADTILQRSSNPSSLELTDTTGAGRASMRVISASNNNAFEGRASAGTVGSPTALASSSVMNNLQGRGWDGATYGIGAAVKLVSSVLFSGSDYSSVITFSTAWGSTAVNERARIGASGALMVNSITTAGTVEKFRVNDPGTVDNTANVILTASAAGAKPLVVQMAASQSVDAFEIQTSTGSVVAYVDSTGIVTGAPTGNGSGPVTALRAQDGEAAATGVGPVLTFTGTSGFNALAQVAALWNGAATTDAYVAFKTRSASVIGERMRLSSGGVLMINATGTPGPGTVEKLRVNEPTTADNAANVMFSASATTSKPLVVQGIVSQAVNLQEWQNSAGTTLASMSLNGTLFAANTGVGTGTDGTMRLKVGTVGSTLKGIVVQGAASQSASLQEWQNSGGAVVASVAGNSAETGFGSLIIQGSAAGQAAIALRTNGSASTPGLLTASTSGEWLGSVAFQGADGSAAASGAFIIGLTSQLWSGTAHGTDMRFYTTPNNSTTNTEVARITNGGVLEVNSTGTPGTVEKFRVNTPTTVNNAAAATFASGSTTDIPLYVQMIASQTQSPIVLASSINNTVFDVSTTGTLRSGAGTTSLASYGFIAESTLGLFRPAAGALGVTVNAEVARFNAQGLEVKSTGAQGTVEAFRVNTPTTVDNLANAIISTSATTSKGLVVQGVASQAANLQEWQDSTGATVGYVSSVGAFGVGSGGAGSVAMSSGGSTYRNALVSNSSNLLDVGSGFDGHVRLIGATGPYIDITVGTNVTVLNRTTTSNIAFTVKGMASQSGDLQQWQDSTAAVLRSISATGALSTRVVAAADATSITVNADTSDVVKQTNTQAGGTLTMNAPTGTPTSGQKLVIRIKCTNSQTYAWNAIFRGSSDTALPASSTGGSKTDYLGFMYNSDDSKWDLIALTRGF